MSAVKQQPENAMNRVNFQDLIINSPEKQVVWKRAGYFLLTLVFWGAWVLLWTPLPGLIEKIFTNGLSEISWRPATYVVVFFAMMLALAAWQIGWLHYNLARFKNRGRRFKQTFLSNQELGHFFTVDNAKLDNWQQSKCLVIQHNETGEIQEIDVNELFSFAPSVTQPTVNDLQLQRYYIVILPDRYSKLLFERVANDFAVIMKVLCASLDIKLQQCRVEKNHLALIVDMPKSYEAGKMLDQLKTASASIIKSKYEVESDLLEASQTFWRKEQLITTTKLTGHEIHQFFAKMVSESRQSKAEMTKNRRSVQAPEKSSKSSRLAKEFWQNSKQLIIENEETKQKTQIDINDFFVCASLPADDKNTENNLERYFVVILPTERQHALFNEIGKNFRVIMKVLCSIFKIGLVDCIVADNYLSLALDIPEGFKPNEFVDQLKKASTVIIEKKYRSTSDKSEKFTFWRDEQLVTTPEFVDIEIKEFLKKTI